jgi:hypothetical protein
VGTHKGVVGVGSGGCAACRSQVASQESEGTVSFLDGLAYMGFPVEVRGEMDT